MNKHIGSSLESFLEERGLKDEVALLTQKKVLADSLRNAMEAKDMNQTELAKHMTTSRSLLRTLLDPTDTSVTLATMVKACAAFGRARSRFEGPPPDPVSQGLHKSSADPHRLGDLMWN